MPRIVRVRRYGSDNLPEHSLTVERLLQLLSRAELDDIRAWAEPWPLLQTLSDREAVDYVQRYYKPGGVFGLLSPRP